MSQPKEVNLGNSVFYIHQFPPFYAMHVLGELQKVIVPVLGGAVKGAKGTNLDANVDDLSVLVDVAGDAIASLPKHLNGDSLEKLSKMLLDPTYVAISIDGREKPIRLTEPVLDEVFIGRPIDMLVLMFKVVKVNFMDFQKLSSVPTGFQTAFGEITKKFTEKFQTNSVE